MMDIAGPFAALGWRDMAGMLVNGRPVQVVDLEEGEGLALPIMDVAAAAAGRATAARALCDAKLSASDWTHRADATLTDAQRGAWRTYRQPLRDAPGQDGFPAGVAWPELPKGA